MAPVIRKAVIGYISPAGATRHVVGVIRDELTAWDICVTEIDLGGDPDMASTSGLMPPAGENVCLVVGSPVYALHPVPPVTAFISQLPRIEGGCAVPFVTWGGVSSGAALHDMGARLQDRGYRILGAAKVMAEHSLMWSSEEPLGKGRPDMGDDRRVKTLIRQVLEKLRGGDPRAIPLSSLHLHPAGERARMGRTTLEIAKARLPPKRSVRGRCTACGRCLDVCPVKALSLTPYPEFADSCIACFNCVRHCPEGAIESDLSPVWARLRARALEVNERPLTQIFV